MGVYIYRLNQPKRIAGESLGLLKYWDKPSWMYPERDKPLIKQRNDMPIGAQYVWAESWETAHGSSIRKDTVGGWNYWYDTNGRFEDTNRVLVKYGKRWEIIPKEAYHSVKVSVKDEEIMYFELYKGEIVCATFDDFYEGKQLSEWVPMGSYEESVLKSHYHMLKAYDDYHRSDLSELMLTTGLRFDSMLETQ